MICLDAYFVKSEFGGQLHVAIGQDANDDIYPIAFAICEFESRATWTWFISTLLADLEGEREYLWSFMSDWQKVSMFIALLLIICLIV